MEHNIVGSEFFAYFITERELVFYTSDMRKITFQHHQDCCEDVYIESVVGDLQDLIDSPIIMFEEVSEKDQSGRFDSATWTFYKFATRKGYVDIRWCGESNGYYSEEVCIDVKQIDLAEFTEAHERFGKLN